MVPFAVVGGLVSVHLVVQEVADWESEALVQVPIEAVEEEMELKQMDGPDYTMAQGQKRLAKC